MATFKEAFRSARKAGKKVFSWNGKSYNTKLSNGTPATVKAPGSRPSKLPDTVKVPGSRPGAAAKTTTARGTPTGKSPTAAPSGRARGSASAPAKGPMGGRKLTIGDRISNSVRVGKTAVDRGHRRDAAKKANSGAGAAVGKMLEGMDKKKKK